MSFPLIAGRPGDYGFDDNSVCGLPGCGTGAPGSRAWLDFPTSNAGGSETVSRKDVIDSVRDIVGLCSSGDGRARAQAGFWHRTLARLHDDHATEYGGVVVEDLRWHYLQFIHRNDPLWRPLCESIEEHYRQRECAEELLGRYREENDHEKRLQIRGMYEAVLTVIHAQRVELNAERLRLSGWHSRTSLYDGLPARRHAGSVSGVARAVVPSAASRSIGPQPLTPTAPPMSASWFDANGVAWPPASFNDRPGPSSNRKAARP